MKLWILSDLHLEYAGLREPLNIPDADVCVMAGDLIRLPANGTHWLGRQIAPSMPCVYVAGNHEFYNGTIRQGLEDARAAAALFSDVHFLENDLVVIDGVRFIGATLWTDYRIEGQPDIAMHYATQRMNDHRQIGLQLNPWQRFLPIDAYHRHCQSRAFIESALRTDHQGPTVVVSHHMPHPKSIHPRFTGDLLNAAFASDLSEVIDGNRIDLWVHGHTHDSFDYRIGDTRIVCNPRGYNNENLKFAPAFVVDV